MTNDPVQRISIAEHPSVSIVIPHFYEARGEALEQMIEILRKQTFRELEILVVHHVSPQGKAINLGARDAKGEILVVMDDDTQVDDPELIEKLVRTVREDPKVAMAGASIVSPKNGNWFQKQAARQFPRFQMPIVQEVIDSDFACHGCVAFRKDVFEQVGRELETIPRGLDPDLRVRIRKAGYRVVLVPQAWVYHPFPPGVFRFMRLFFRNGIGSAYTQDFYPELTYDTDEVLESKEFIPKRSFGYRISRFFLRLLKSFLSLQWIRLLGYVVYAVGYGVGMLKYRFQSGRQRA